MHRRTGALALTVAVAAIATGCGTTASTAGPTVLTVQVADDASGAAYRALLGELDRQRRDLRIVVRELPADEARGMILERIGRIGLADIVTIDASWLPELMLYSDQFASMPRATLGGEDEPRWPEWAVRTVTDTAGRVYAYPATTAPRALCYRTDLVEAAGLPADPEEFGALAKDWATLLRTASTYTAATGAPFLDSMTATYDVMIDPVPAPYEKRATGEVVATTNPRVRAAFDRVTADPAVFARLEPGTAAWYAGAESGAFAASLCAAGTLEHAVGAPEPAAPDADAEDREADAEPAPVPDEVAAGSGTLAALRDAGWEVAGAFPGGGATSALSAFAIPGSGAHIDLAREVADWLTAPEQQLAVFAAVGAFPTLAFETAGDDGTDADPAASATPDAEATPDSPGDPETPAADEPSPTATPVAETGPFGAPLAALLRERAAAIPAMRFRGPETPEIDRLMAIALARVADGTDTPAAAWDRWAQAVTPSTAP